MVKENTNNDSSHNKNTLVTPDKSSVAKSQESYPGPRSADKAPEFVKEWQAEPPRTITPSSDELNTNQDLAIQHRIVEMLKKEIDGFENIEIQVKHAVVTLTGTVRYEVVKSNVALLTRRCEGVDKINNNLNVED